MKEFKCARCGVVQDVPSWIQRDSLVKPWPHRCTRCGAVHSFLKGGYEVISPAMLPVDAGGRLSPWIAGNHTPVVPGVYDTNWRDVDAHLKLEWNGTHWMYGVRRVLGVIVAWRGVWA
jgi:DNA-directed RNA polymerase subunit RPC12/RpoP